MAKKKRSIISMANSYHDAKDRLLRYLEDNYPAGKEVKFEHANRNGTNAPRPISIGVVSKHQMIDRGFSILLEVKPEFMDVVPRYKFLDLENRIAKISYCEIVNDE
jgi:hypothetical protein